MEVSRYGGGRLWMNVLASAGGDVGDAGLVR